MPETLKPEDLRAFLANEDHKNDDLALTGNDYMENASPLSNKERFTNVPSERELRMLPARFKHTAQPRSILNQSANNSERNNSNLYIQNQSSEMMKRQ